MYLIRASSERPILTIELSGHVTSEEAVRLLTMAGELARTDNVRAVFCDVSALEYGPERPATVAAMLAAIVADEVRIAVTGQPTALRGIRRIVRMARASGAVRLFASPAEAESWLADAVGARTALPAMAQRHLEDLFGVRTGPDPSAAPPRRISAA